ncbi:MAG: hypothetical protein HOE14_18775 [Gemmatimonadales bacterium]|nr:hypothetical protein [Gemmatimonadales bacterium]
MFKRAPTAAFMLPVLTACGASTPPAPPPPPPFSPACTFDIMLEMQGMSMGGILVISGSAEAGWGGSIEVEMGGTGLGDVVVSGNTVTFSLAEIGGTAELEFEGDEFMGIMSSSMGDASLQGTKRAGN